MLPSTRPSFKHFISAVARYNVMPNSVAIAPTSAAGAAMAVNVLHPLCPSSCIVMPSRIVMPWSSLLGSTRHVATRYWANQAQTVYSKQDVDQWIEDFPNLSQYEAEDIEKWRNAFDTYDLDNDGYISPADLQKNQNLSLPKVKLLKEADRDNNNLIDFGEFVSVISSLDVADIRRTYEGFDSVDVQLEFEKFAVQNQGGSKMIMRVPQLKRLMTYCDCICVTDKDAERLLAEMDTGADGVIDFEEFKTWLKRTS